MLCQIQLYRWSQQGILQRPSFRLFGAPYTCYATLVFLVAVVVLMCFENYWNPVALFVLVPALVGGWYAVRGRGCSRWHGSALGSPVNYPVAAGTPLMDKDQDKDARD